MVLVGEHGLDVAPDQGQEQGHAQAGGDQVEQGGLGVFVDVHHGDCSQEASQVRCMKVKLIITRRSILILWVLCVRYLST